MKILSWNINGFRSILNKKYLNDLINEIKPDIFCLQEIKLDKNNAITNIFNEYKSYYNYSNIKGYSGTVIFSLIEPIKVIYGMKGDDNNEGRLITCEFNDYYLIHVYTPNSGQFLNRLEYRVNKWDVNFIKHLIKLQKKKPIIVCGDLNVAHKEIDLKNPKKNLRTAGFTIEERISFQNILDKTQLIDTFRYLNTSSIKYSYWNYRFKCREKNIGWRIDYFLVSKKIINKIVKSDILTDILGSDHAPLIFEINI